MRALLLLSSALAFAGPVRAEADFEGQFLVQALALDKPNDPDTYAVDKQYALRESWRESGILGLGKSTKFEYGLYLISHHLSEQDDFDHLSLLYNDPRHRTSELDYFAQKDVRRDAYLSFDRLMLRGLFKKNTRWQIGRFPIDFSKTFLFRPNDIFGPSTYNQIDPYHKAGVDAIQLSGPLPPLGEWKLLAVAGYKPLVEAEIDPDGLYITPRNRLDIEQSSFFLSFVNTFAEQSLQILLGTYQQNILVMGSLEGELGSTSGYRLEAKQAFDKEETVQQFSLVLGLDYRWNEQNLLFTEFFLNGAGYKSIEFYQLIENSPYKPIAQYGRTYAGLGWNSDISPLLTLRVTAQQNLVDQSSFATGSLNYSATDHWDLGVLATLAQGTPPSQGNILTEYGAFPSSLGLQTLLRW